MEIVENTPLSEKLRKSKGIILMDLDGVALNPNYLPTNLEGLRQGVQSLQEAGVLVGLHSDTPLASLLQFAEMFGIKGPLIFEMAAIHFPEEGIDIVLDPSNKDFFAHLRDGLYDAARKQFQDNTQGRYLISKTSDKNMEKRTKTKYPGYQHGIWINPFRQFSLGLWAEGVGSDGSTFVDDTFHNKVIELIRKFLVADPEAPPMGSLFFDDRLTGGTSVVRPLKFTTKTPAVQALLSFIGDYTGPVYMIGDENTDYIEDPRVINLAVGNASDNFLSRLHNDDATLPQGIQRVSSGNYTSGAIEHLKSIALSLELPKDTGVIQKDVFSKYFSGGNIRKIREEDIPDFVNRYLSIDLNMGGANGPSEYFLVSYGQEGKTFIIKQAKPGRLTKDVDDVLYFVDLNDKGEVLGYSRVRTDLTTDNPHYRNKPYVAMVQTLKPYQRQGIGKRRYLLMNAVTQMLYGVPLRSDISLSHDAERMWDRLVEEGKASIDTKNNLKRYVFKT